MTDTQKLIARLSSEAQAVTPARTPHYWAVRLLAVLVLYSLAAQFFLKLRPDLALQVSRPFYAVEIAVLVLLLISSAVASVLAMYPDAYQKRGLLKLPYLAFALLICVIFPQLFITYDASMVMPKPGAHGMECALCIASVALVPSTLIFALLRKGASVHPLQAGSFGVLAASAIGCLTMRLAEANDSIAHVISWHYLPTVLFAILGACFGKWLLKW